MREREQAPAIALPRRPAAVDALEVTSDVLLDVAGALAAADTALDVAGAALRLLVRLPGVRACLVVRTARAGADPVVLASAGYDCTTTGTGAVLPRGAGLPVTEAVRTGGVQVVGTGPSWAAVPCGPGAALLLSLTVPPPDDDGRGAAGPPRRPAARWAAPPTSEVDLEPGTLLLLATDGLVDAGTGSTSPPSSGRSRQGCPRARSPTRHSPPAPPRGRRRTTRPWRSCRWRRAGR